jgi:hypothetical protein
MAITPRLRRPLLALGLATGVLAILCVPAPQHAADNKPPDAELADRVRKAIDNGVRFLRDKAQAQGDWERLEGDSHNRPGGWTALALLALLNCGVPPEDPLVQRALESLRKVPADEKGQTYVVGLQTMVYCLAGQKVDAERIQRNVDWLIKARHMDGDKLLGWSYQLPGRTAIPDNSNTQYALLGLHEAHVAGYPVPAEVWQSIRDYYLRTKTGDGGWKYRADSAGPSLTMTTAGLCGLLIAGMDLESSLGAVKADGTHPGCGQYKENEAVVNALRWIGRALPEPKRWDELPNVYYCLYGLERAGRFSGHRFFGEHDWYREGCEFLVGKQRDNGAWRGRGMFREDGEIVATSFALLFLSKGRTPVLISKLAHGDGNDWNNDRSDCRHLTEYVVKQRLFRKRKGEPGAALPVQLAWQVFDIRRLGDLPRDRLQGLTAELLQSPILYFNGHLPPRLSGSEEELLKQYVENGGFIFAEACCGKEDFDKGFRRLMADLFPRAPLKKLPVNHPIWTAAGPSFAVLPTEFQRPVELWGIEMGCKTVVVYCPQDLSCWWESNQYDKGDGQRAFKLGANVIAYATGLEAPRPRLTRVAVNRDDAAEVKRGYFTVAQLEHDGGRPAATALRNLLSELRDPNKAGIDVDVRAKDVQVNSPAVADYRFLFMHGKNGFAFEANELKHLRFNLETGGTLLADACCGSKAFDESFRQFIRAMWHDKPEIKLEPIPLSDELYSEALNGSRITKVRCRTEKTEGKLTEVDPFLEGVKINGRWVVVYSKYDIGCALEKHQSPECLGHDYDSAVLLGRAVVLYAMKR